MDASSPISTPANANQIRAEGIPSSPSEHSPTEQGPDIISGNGNASISNQTSNALILETQFTDPRGIDEADKAEPFAVETGRFPGHQIEMDLAHNIQNDQAIPEERSLEAANTSALRKIQIETAVSNVYDTNEVCENNRDGQIECPDRIAQGGLNRQYLHNPTQMTTKAAPRNDTHFSLMTHANHKGGSVRDINKQRTDSGQITGMDLVQNEEGPSGKEHNTPKIPSAQNVIQGSSYASLVNADDGFSLNYIPAQTVNGSKVTQIDKEEVQAEIDYWANAVLCTVLGANPPLEVITGYINRIWKAFELDKIIQVRKGIFLVRFHHNHEKLDVEKRGIYYFDSKPFIVKGWNPKMDLHTEAIKSLPIWIQLPELDLKYWGQASLSKIGSLIGQPLKTDKYTAEKSRLNYARLLIDVPLDGAFPNYVEFFNEKETLVRQTVKYEWLPTKCNHCGMFGHLEENCKKKQAPKKVWRRVEKEQDINATPPIGQNLDISQHDGIIPVPVQDNHEFMQVTRKGATRMGTQQASHTTISSNSFQVLQNISEVPNQVETELDIVPNGQYS